VAGVEAFAVLNPNDFFGRTAPVQDPERGFQLPFDLPDKAREKRLQAVPYGVSRWAQPSDPL